MIAHEDCEVVFVGNAPDSLGYYCFVKYSDWYGVLAHLREMATKGKYLVGDIIAYTGDSGFGTGAHLHFEAWYDYPTRRILNKSNWRDLTFPVLEKF